MTDDKRPVDQAVDFVLYAPLGFVLEARHLLPTFVERGRMQVQMARMIGQFAVQQGQVEAGKQLTKAQAHAEAVLTELGLRPSAASPATRVAEPAAAPVPAPTAAPAPTARSSAAAAELPIADYDSLAASQVIPRLTGLEVDELEAVRAYEAAHRGRKTILGKVAQLQAG